LIMAATVSLGPLSLAPTLSHTSRMYSQFSEVRFSSVALAGIYTSELCHAGQGARGMLTDGIIEGVLLCPKHGAQSGLSKGRNASYKIETTDTLFRVWLSWNECIR
jgi:hypothetical protein